MGDRQASRMPSRRFIQSAATGDLSSCGTRRGRGVCSVKVTDRAHARIRTAAARTICAAIAARRLLEFEYRGAHRIVAPYCHGRSRQGAEVLRAVQLRRPNSRSPSGGFGFGKLWHVAAMANVQVRDEAFAPDDPGYNPNDSAMAHIHCRV
jgi:hypothetical protein